MANAKGKVVVSAEVPESVRDDLDSRARVEGRSRAKVIFRAVRFYLAHAPVVRADEVPVPKPRKDGKQK
jgi:hypothetical protein